MSATIASDEEQRHGAREVQADERADERGADQQADEERREHRERDRPEHEHDAPREDRAARSPCPARFVALVGGQQLLERAAAVDRAREAVDERVDDACRSR